MHAHPTAPASRLLGTWILLLAGAQVADVLTTAVDLARGGIEANGLVSSLLSIGGLGLVLAFKVLLVAAMAIACLALQRYAEEHPNFRARVTLAFVWRALQLSVVGLVVVAVHNTALLVQIS
jgi:hypothetical protein